MTAYPKMTAEEWKAEYAEVTREYEELKARGLNLNMARGKPCTSSSASKPRTAIVSTPTSEDVRARTWKDSHSA